MQRVHTINCHKRPISIKFSNDGHLVAALVGEQTVYVWYKDGYDLLGFITINDWIRDFCLLPDGKTIIIISAYIPAGKPVAKTTDVSFFDIKTGHEIAHYHGPDIRSITYCNEETPLATGVINDWQTRYHQIDLHDYQYTSDLGSLILPQNEIPIELAYCPLRNLLASVGVGASLWNLSTKTLLWDMISDLREGKISIKGVDVWEAMSIAISGNGEFLAVGHWGTDKGATEKVCLYSIRLKKQLGWYCRGFQSIDSITLTPNGRFIAGTGSMDAGPNEACPLAQIWDIETGNVYDECKLEGMSVTKFSPDGRLLVTGANSPNSIVFWEFL
ncbi:MAG: WD40 repeat domain-containing protein [Anaerolineae bacterium]|nr:WD40 repeat domain-containing protein [Anaerolineae bacterium]